MQLMSHIRLGIYTGIISSVTEKELLPAPEQVRAILDQLDEEDLARVIDSDEIADLAEAYLAEKIVSASFRNDALHIASATVHQADVLVSWNFRHIVNLRRIELFNAVNIREGYGWLEIRTRRELIYGKEEKGL